MFAVRGEHEAEPAVAHRARLLFVRFPNKRFFDASLVVIFCLSILLPRQVYPQIPKMKFVTPAQREIAVDTLSAAHMVGGEDFFERPIAVCTNMDGHVLVLDQWQNCVWVFDYDGTPLDRYFAPEYQNDHLSSPRDMAVDSRSWIYIADTGNNRIAVLDERGNFKFELDLGFDVITIDVLKNGNIFVQSNPNTSSHLMNIYTPEGKKIGEIGKLWIDKLGREGMNRALNRYYAAGTQGTKEIIIARQGIPLVSAIDVDSREGYSFLITGSEIDTTRSRYFYSLSESFAQNQHSMNQNPGLQNFIADIENTIVDGGRPTIVQYIAGAEYYGDRIYLLVDGRILVYSLDGVLHARYELVGPDGERIYSHRIYITNNGSLYTIDKAHAKVIYEFWLPKACFFGCCITFIVFYRPNCFCIWWGGKL